MQLIRKKKPDITKKTTPMLLAIATFAVTASGVHAFSSTEILTNAGLTDEQVIAVQEAQELKASGDFAAARETLEAAGIDRDTMRSIKEAMREAKQAVRDAVTAGDWNAFQVAVADSPLAEFVTTEADFDQFVAAHELRASGDRAGATGLLEELGIDTDRSDRHGYRTGRADFRTALAEQLTDDQREALQVAREANDRDAVRAILEEAGIEHPERSGRGHRSE